MEYKRQKTVRFRVGRTIYRIEIPQEADAEKEIKDTGFTNFKIIENV